MAINEADLEYGPTPDDATYEHTDIEPAIASRFAIWLAIAMLMSGAIVYGTFWWFEGRAETMNREAQLFPLAVGQQKEPPAPRLQTQPFKDVYQLKSGQLEKLNSYGWVDQATGVVHIPIDEAMRIIGEEGTGVVVLISRPSPGYATRAIADLDHKHEPADDDHLPPEQRDYGVGAQILAELGVRDMILLTNTKHSLVGLEGYDLSIVGERPIGPV